MQTIKYTGTDNAWDELPYTGKPSIWRVGQREERSDAEASALLATGLFDTDPVQMMGKRNPLTGKVEISAGGEVVDVGGSAVSITGTGAVGSVLTATLGAGWACTGYQWTRGGVDISGATTTTYTIQYADAGLAVACRVSGLSNAATGVTIASAVYEPPYAIVMTGDATVHNSIVGPTSLSGVTNSSKGSMSFWYQPFYNNTVDNIVFRASSSNVNVTVGPDKRLLVEIKNIASIKFWTSVITPATEASHYAISWDTNFPAGTKHSQLYRNGVIDKTVVWDGDAAFTPVLTGQPSLGATNGGSVIGPGTFREVMYWPGVEIDWGANIGKVYAAGSPVDVGPTGALVTGTAPAMYLSLRNADTAPTFLENRGTGGNFSQRAGTPTIRADQPIIAYGDSLVYGTAATAYPSKTWLLLTCRGLNTPRRDMNYGIGGESTAAIRTRFIAALPTHFAAFGNKPIWILEGGYNSLAGTSAAIIAEFQTMVNALLEADPSAKFVVMGIANNQSADQQIGGAKFVKIQEVGSALTTMVGSKYLDVRQWLVDNGLAAAGVTTPTADDLTDISTGVVPRSLRSEDLSVHWNDLGQIAVAAMMKAKIQALGYD